MTQSKRFQTQRLLPARVGRLQTCHRSWSRLILCTLELINRSLQEGNQSHSLDRLQWWPELLEHPTDLKISTFFLAPRTGFHAIKLMTSADGCSEHNGYQSFTQFELEHLLHLPLEQIEQITSRPVYLLRASALIFPSKDFPRSVWSIFQTNPHLQDWDEIDFTVIIFSIPAGPFCPG